MRDRGTVLMIGIIIVCLMLTGCTSSKPPIIKPAGSIVVKDKLGDSVGEVEFNTNRSAEMTYKTADGEYTYNSQSESLLSKIMSALTLGAIGARR